MIDFIVGILASAIRAGTPILFATQGEILSEKSGVMNIGLEGMMLVGAMYGFIFTGLTGSPWIGFLMAGVTAGILSLLHAVLTIVFGANQVVSGISLNFIGTGLTSVLGSQYVGKAIKGFPILKLGPLADIPILGKIFFEQDILVYVSLFLSALLVFVLYKTKIGMDIRAVGDSPVAADAAGIPLKKVRALCVFFGGVFCGFGGAYMSIAYTTLWQPEMTAGRGWIAVALVIFAQWNPSIAVAGSYLFGGVTALQLAMQVKGSTISSQLLKMMPYLFTILALSISMLKAKRKGWSTANYIGPAALGQPYFRGK